ncbi:MAG: hypothetical protein R3C68_15745 [Myxococcota bacterium]
MDSSYKRVNIMLLEKQYQILTQQGLNVSGLIRDLVGDHLSENVVTIQVSDETRKLYNAIVANTGATDEEIEVHLRAALAKVLERKIAAMRELHQQLTNQEPK